MEWFEKIKRRREELKMSQADLAKEIGVSQAAIGKIEGGQVQQSKATPKIAKILGLNLADLDPSLAEAVEDASTPFVLPPPNASRPTPVQFPKAERLPVFGQGVGGDDGKFVLNGQRVADAMCPPNLIGVRDAYAVFVDGTSMEPRYFAGETVFLHPHIPVRQGDFVVAQIAADVEGDPPYGYVKQFISKSSRGLVLRQLNPPEGQDELMHFPPDKVVGVHKIVFLEQG